MVKLAAQAERDEEMDQFMEQLVTGTILAEELRGGEESALSCKTKKPQSRGVHLVEQYRETSHTHTEMETRKLIVCGLSASRIRPPLPQEDTDDDVEDITPTEVEVVEISDEEEDMVELSREEYMRNMDYLIRVEESEDDIELDFRRMLKRMHEE
ncbi:hypothetical protein Bca4012_064626 [Brassica carinata]